MGGPRVAPMRRDCNVASGWGASLVGSGGRKTEAFAVARPTIWSSRAERADPITGRRFIPFYSPDLDPIEMAFAKLKA
jgi:hypothetical protein